MLLQILQSQLYVFSGDGRCDSPGNNTKYLTYTFLECSINKIVAMSGAQFTEYRESNRMEKYDFQKVLHGIEARDINMKEIKKEINKFIR